MAKIDVDVEYIKEGLQSIGYEISSCIERENNGKNWQIKFSNSGAMVTIYDTNRTHNTVVNGRPEIDEKEGLKTIVDALKCKELQIDPLNKEICELINTHREDYYYDFKEIPHGDKGDLLHDILCLSNNTENREAYLIIGVTNTYEVVGIDEHFASNDYYDFLKTIKFAGDHMPEIDVKVLYYKFRKIGVIICKSSKYVPFYLTEKHRDVNSHQIYTRVGDTNTPKNRNASYTDTEKLWLIHFDREHE